ncbi:MAG: FkbM family methyltransferase, partial [Thermoprotei archaeon]
IHGFAYGEVFNAFSDYSWLNVEGRRALDVGASIGDTAIYFSLRGAKEVVAFEPYPFPYRFAVENVEANGLRNVRLINAAVADENGSIRLTTGETTTGDDLKPSEDGVEVPVYSLDRVLEEYGPFEVLKMDCEGCEYGALISSRRIGELKQIQVEYHYGPERIVEALSRAGFEVKFTGSHKSHNPYATDPNMLVGYVYAWK